MADSSIDKIELLRGVFTDLRSTIPALGVRDLLDALRLLDGDWEFDSISENEGPKSLQKYVRLLWCRDPWMETREFNRLWEKHTAQKDETLKHEKTTASVDQRGEVREPEKAPAESFRAPQTAGEQPQPRKSSISAVPVKAPSGLTFHHGPKEISTLWPIRKRAMSYGWQYLRRPRNDGPETLLDIEATVKDVARLGYLLKPVLTRELRNHAHLVLLIDRSDSMIPFSYLTRDLVESAQMSVREGAVSRVDVFYFRDVIANRLYSDPYLMEMVKTGEPPLRLATIEEALSHCHRDSSLLILSDAGVRLEKSEESIDRLMATQEMLFRLSKITPLMAWLNPWPKSRWLHTTAGSIATTTPMFEINKAGFNGALKVLQGKSKGKPR